MNFLICAIIKNENLYLREWVEYHLNLGFNKIVIYDNNDNDGEKPQIVIQDYIDSGEVEVINFRGYKGPDICYYSMQTDAYNDFIKNHKQNNEWVAFIDIDEFIYIEKYKTIEQLFNNTNYNEYDCVLLSWKTFGDSGHLYYENKPVQERFKIPANKIPINSSQEYNTYVKSIVKVNSNNIEFTYNNAHCCSSNCCNALGNTCNMNNRCNSLNTAIHSECYIKHYYTKSLMEFLQRKLQENTFMFVHLENYKAGNGWSEEHEKVYQNFLKQNNIKQ